MPFTTPSQITIEKSPAYFISKMVPQRVKRLNPNMKLIVVVRNPITRAVSDYTQAVTRRKRSISNAFEEMAKCDEINSTKCHHGINSSWGAIRIGQYHKYLQNWLEHFPMKQFMFVDGENLIRQPANEIRKVEKFLGLTPVVKSSDFVMDKIKGFPCVRKVNSSTPHCLGKSKGRVHPTVNSDVVKQLQMFYQPENEKFFKMINETFKW